MDEKNEAILQIQREIFAQTLEKYKLDKFLP